MKRALCIVLVALPVAACAIGEDRHETVTYPLRTVSKTRTCATDDFDKPDLSKLAACGAGKGKGHCFPNDKTPIDGFVKDTCTNDGDVCIADPVLAAGGGKLKDCKVSILAGKPGACMSMLVPSIASHDGQLKQDGCDADERCAPCNDPSNGDADTKICHEIGVHRQACQGGAGKADALCCHGAGVCISPEAAPEDQRDSLGHDTCGAKVCAPAALVDNTPVKCHALGLSGVCIDVCFAQMLGPSQPILGGDCRVTEVCLPCLIGAGEGVPGC